MKINLRWQLLLAVTGFALVLSLLSFQVQSSSLCQVEVPAAGGLFVEGVVGAPRYLNPLLSDDNPVDRELVSLLFDGLTKYDAAGVLVPDLARWTVEEEGRVIRFMLLEGKQWHDGEPVTAVDVVYTYRLMQDDAFPGPAALRMLWQAVEIEQVDEMTVLFRLPEPYAPFLEATTRGILPAHLLQGTTAVNLPAHSFNDAPVGSGPLLVAPGQDWRANGRLRLLPNPTVWRQGIQLDGIEYRFYPDSTLLLDDFAAGRLQAINQVPDAQLPQLAALPEARLFTAREPRYTTLLFNLSPSAQGEVNQLPVRQALALALDREQLVDQVLHGQGVVFEGPYLPSSWAYHPDLLTQYNAQLETAVNLLEAQGWGLAAETAVRQKEGASLVLRFVTLDTPRQQQLAQAIAQQWARIGVGVTFEIAPDLPALQAVLASRTFDAALFDVRPTGDPDLYDFWSQEAIVRGQNYAGWNMRRASEALESGRQIWQLAERRPFYDTFLRLYNDALPALTLYQHVHTYAVRSDVNNLDIGLIDNPRDRYQTLSDWFIRYREVNIACPATPTTG